ncbi:MAG: hypothetical protein ROO71_08235 [Balneola sp.]
MTESVARNNEGEPIGFENCEFVSVFDHWLLPNENHLLDSVNPKEWKKFWALNDLLFEKYQVFALPCHVALLRDTNLEAQLPLWRSLKQGIPNGTFGTRCKSVTIQSIGGISVQKN